MFAAVVSMILRKRDDSILWSLGFGIFTCLCMENPQTKAHWTKPEWTSGFILKPDLWARNSQKLEVFLVCLSHSHCFLSLLHAMAELLSCLCVPLVFTLLILDNQSNLLWRGSHIWSLTPLNPQPWTISEEHKPVVTLHLGSKFGKHRMSFRSRLIMCQCSSWGRSEVFLHGLTMKLIQHCMKTC